MRYRDLRPRAPLVVGLAGTDLYQDLPDVAGGAALARARHPAHGPAAARARGAAPRGPPQGARPRPVGPPRPRHAAAAGRLPRLPGGARPGGEGRVPRRGGGAAPARAIARAGRRTSARRSTPAPRPTPAARWRRTRATSGSESGVAARRSSILAGSQLLVITSRLEGGSNALSEAVASGVPVLSTRIDGSVGLLGPMHPGLFPVGDAAALAGLLPRAEEDAAFLAALRAGRSGCAPRRARARAGGVAGAARGARGVGVTSLAPAHVPLVAFSAPLGTERSRHPPPSARYRSKRFASRASRDWMRSCRAA